MAFLLKKIGEGAEQWGMSRPTSTQIGAVAENVVANVLMVESGGRLSPFSPVADDDGIDLLIYDKETGRALPAQVKSRTGTIRKRRSIERGSVVHFEVRKATFKSERHACVILVLLTSELSAVKCAWVIPMRDVPSFAADRSTTCVVRASSSIQSKDRFRQFRCDSARELVTAVLSLLSGAPEPGGRQLESLQAAHEAMAATAVTGSVHLSREGP